MSMEDFWAWAKAAVTDADEEPVIGAERCDDFDKEIWLESRR